TAREREVLALMAEGRTNVGIARRLWLTERTVATLTRRYAALRALRVTVWRPAAEGLPVAVDGRPGEWRLPVRVGYCFVAPNCTPSTVEIGTRWRLAGDEPRLVAVEESRARPAGVRPWEVSDLAVAVGKRTVVATTPGQRAKLPGLLAQAEAAARVADRYAVDGAPPDRYLVFYAGRAEWQRWYGGGRPKWTAGYAVGVGGGHHDVVLNAQSLSPTGVDDLLRHELTHAASLPDRGYSDRSSWWLVEGLAEYAGADGQPVDRYEGLAEVRRLIRGGWNGRLDSLAPADDAADDRVGAAYGVGYLAVRHLVDRYGEQRVLDFFRAVVDERKSMDAAADEVFGERWSALHDDCVGYVRAVAG
ncbi:LuxR C-terminal-related transcriptional regulator, partial [Micromonospora sp. NPDC003776]